MSHLSPHRDALRTRHRVVEEVHWRLAHNAKSIPSDSSVGSPSGVSAFRAASPRSHVYADNLSRYSSSSGSLSSAAGTGGGLPPAKKTCSSPGHVFTELESTPFLTTSSAPAAVGNGSQASSSALPEQRSRDAASEESFDAGGAQRRAPASASACLERSEESSGGRGSAHESAYFVNSHFPRGADAARYQDSALGEHFRRTSGGSLEFSSSISRRRPLPGAASHSLALASPTASTPSGAGSGERGPGRGGHGGTPGLGGVRVCGAHEGQYASGSSHSVSSGGISKKGQARLLHAALNCAVGRGSDFPSSSHSAFGHGGHSASSRSAGEGARGERRLESPASAGAVEPTLGVDRDSPAASTDARGGERDER
ncbi:hypothetical protein BESB_085610 [Besnoitia besnoiti]|uniref:Uncharacterized protein n=1 Tax=Besnoitia besnoiti TaxID=94643 RepID=A0A2A9MDB8_BESBE|nr:hypothetical protein BESB_085610 [Besnoitia besnoiti]PFH33362.1 hypothetical protein BESB_085610 [Besnoitia besnoiti]